MKNIRLGIIGIGVESEVYANFLTEGKVKNMVLGAICDIDPDRKMMCAEKYPSIPFYDHYIDMLLRRRRRCSDYLCSTLSAPRSGHECVKKKHSCIGGKTSRCLRKTSERIK